MLLLPSLERFLEGGVVVVTWLTGLAVTSVSYYIGEYWSAVSGQLFSVQLSVVLCPSVSCSMSSCQMSSAFLFIVASWLSTAWSLSVIILNIYL